MRFISMYHIRSIFNIYNIRNALYSYKVIRQKQNYCAVNHKIYNIHIQFLQNDVTLLQTFFLYN